MSLNWNHPALIAAGVAATVAAIVGASLAFGSPGNTVNNTVREVRNPPPGTAPDASWLARYAASREYHHVTAQPDGARIIPIVGRTYTPIVPNPQRRKVFRAPGMTVQVLREIKRALRAAGRSDEDARCVWALWCIESGHGRSIWNWNVGNIKAPGATGVPAEITSAQPHVGTTNPYPNSIYLLIDGVHSFDGYYGFATLDDYCRYQKRFFETTLGDHGGQRYAGVLEGYRQGGPDGLAAAAHALSTGGYSSEPGRVRAAEHLFVWDLYKHAAGGAVAWDSLR